MTHTSAPGPHRYPAALRFVFAFTTAILVAVTLMFAWLVVELSGWPLRALCLACAGATAWGVMHCVGWMGRVRETLATTPHGLVVSRGATHRMIEWHQVAALRSSDAVAELRVLGAGGQILACIGYHVKGFAALRDEIVARVRLPTAARFRSSRASVAVTLALAVLAGPFLAALVLLGGHYLVAGAIAAALLYTAAARRWTLRIQAGGFEVRRLFRRGFVPFASIQCISLGAASGQPDVAETTVTIERRGERPVVLRNAGRDAITLYQSLRAAHRAYLLATPARASLAQP